MVSKETGGLVGGNYKCELHNFESADVKEFNAHCQKYPDIHKDGGNTLCIDCGKRINFQNIDYHPTTPQGKNMSLRCKGCLLKYIDSNKALLGLK